MKRSHAFLVFSIVALVTGCAGTQSANMMVGNDVSYASLQEQRDASLEVLIYERMPEEAQSLGRVESSRCHRDTVDIAPSQEVLELDLKISAWARGANGISNIQKVSESGLLKNCWYVITVTADSFIVEAK